MRSVCWFILALALCVAALSGTALAQQDRAWFGAEVVDVTKAEADKLGWDAPHGAKVSRIEPGSPAAKAGLKVGDILLNLDRMLIDSAADFNISLESRRPSTEVRLRVLSGGREIGVAAVLGQRPTVLLANDAPILQLDAGGHMGLINGLAFTPDGNQLVSVGEDKVIRVWDWHTGAPVRSIRGQGGAGLEGKLYAAALSSDARWLAAGGFMAPGFGVRNEAVGDIRLYEFATGRLVALLKGHTDVVLGLGFAPDGRQLISGDWEGTAIIWDVEQRSLAHRLKGHSAEIYTVAFLLRHDAQAVDGRRWPGDRHAVRS